MNAFGSLAEKIFVQLDNNIYTNDQTIWFNAKVVHAVDHTPTKFSRVLYLELIDSHEKIIEKKLIQIADGTGSGFFQLNDSHAEGVYMVRAYTEWNRNFADNFFFREYINVYESKSPAEKAEPFSHIILSRNESQGWRLRSTINPDDSSHRGRLFVELETEHKKDTLYLEKGEAGNYYLDYQVPKEAVKVHLTAKTKNTVVRKSVLIQKDYLDISFFPEAGKMVQGFPALVAVKIVDPVGRGRKEAGWISDRHGNTIATFTTNEMGFGKVLISKADSSAGYYAKIASVSTGQFPLPQVSAKGFVLSAQKVGDSIRMRAFSSSSAGDSIVLRISCRGKVEYDIMSKLKNGAFEFLLPAASLPGGVVAFSLLNQEKRLVAQRLYFNHQISERLQLTVSSDSLAYAPRSETRLNVVAKSSIGEKAKVNMSVQVISDAQTNPRSCEGANIYSYLLMTSDFNESIETPSCYFTGDSVRFGDMDLLLVTLGSEKYNYNFKRPELKYPVEQNLALSGQVKGGIFRQKQKKGVGLTIMTFGEQRDVQAQNTDSTGRFIFGLRDLFTDAVNILIQTTNKSGKQADFTILVDKHDSPPVRFDRRKTLASPDSIALGYVKIIIAHQKSVDSARVEREGKTLKEVVVTAQLMTPEKRAIQDQYGKATTIIDGDAIRAKEAKWSYGLYSVLLFNFPGQVKVRRFGDGILYASLHNSEITLVVVDGIPVKAYDYSLIPNIPPSEVKSFELIPYAKNFRSLYCDVIPENCGMAAPATGNVIAIYTYAKSGLFGARQTPGLLKTAIPVFAATRSFTGPDYSGLNRDSLAIPDLRTLIHWAPVVNTDSTGNSPISFHNSDIKGRNRVIVQAVSVNGEVGYKEYFFDVKL